jgi:cytoskeletal protein CcmA (bactofilin family)
MPFSSGTFTRTFDCTTDRDNGVKILASKFDTEFDGIATGLSTCILKDGTQTCTAAIPFAEGLTVPDNKTIVLGTNSDITIQYDETTNDALEIAANVEGAALGVVLKADQGDDNADQHKLNIADGGVLTLQSKISGGFVTYLTHTPNATVADSTTAVAGNLTVAGDLTLGSGAVINEAELEAIDGVTAGTVAASKAVIVDGNKDIASFRNVTLTGELDAGSLDISGDADIDGTLEADAMTLNGTAITATATLDTGISNNNVPKFTSGVADDDFLRVAGTAIEGRSASEVLSDIGAAPAAGSSNIVTTGALDSGSITSGFGSIDNGSSAITTTGTVTGGSVVADNITIDGNTISSTDTNGSVTVDPNGSGQINLSANVDVTGTVTVNESGSANAVQRIQAGTNGYAAQLQLYGNNVSGAAYNSVASYVNGDATPQWEITGPEASAEDQMLLHTGGSERLRITSGNVGIGTSSPSDFGGTTLQTNHGSTYSANLVSSGTHVLQMLASQTHGAMSMGARSNHHVAFTTNDTERMRLLAGGGLTFNGDTAAANALDDYEEGTWTPVLGGTTGDPTVSYDIQKGWYQKFGSLVCFGGRLQWNTSGSSGGSGDGVIKTLPFAAGGPSQVGTGCAFIKLSFRQFNGSFSSGRDNIDLAIETLESRIRIYQLDYDDPSGSNYTQIGVSQCIGGDARLDFSGHYTVS